MQFGPYFIDGYAEAIYPEAADERNWIKVTPFKSVKKRYLFEYRGCSFHPCTQCNRRPFRAAKKVINGPDGHPIQVDFTRDELLAKEDARIHAIVDDIRQRDGLEDWGAPPVLLNELGIAVMCEGPQNFPHTLVIKMACRWIKEWRSLELDDDESAAPYSKTYPFLFKGAKTRSGIKAGKEGVTHDDFKRALLDEDENGNSKFFGFAMVDLWSPPEVVEKYIHTPPIFARKELTLEHLQGDLARTLSEKQKQRMFPCEENVFCFNVEDYFISSELLVYYLKMGLKFRVKYFVSYYRDKPFKDFVNTLVADRVKAAQANDTSMANWIKFVLNSAVGYFAINRAKFMNTKILSSGDLYTALRNPRLKALNTLRNEGHNCDPLHEALFKKNVSPT
ncbi:Oidioi.mRNA.OKI2018_I69.chr2.g7966.t1.cds [Oikopleura dioica]|uniref:DNA-directed DNA polymerase n=1 Tax=Oikopleura dioica TaxID=34765 RepID=A0ABN7TG65_OIKDI|nr:Oidioi.mRNA.OKI2018_I69.chr2.g7966.t1.cds [Oikopleura dioica]